MIAISSVMTRMRRRHSVPANALAVITVPPMAVNTSSTSSPCTFRAHSSPMSLAITWTRAPTTMPTAAVPKKARTVRQLPISRSEAPTSTTVRTSTTISSSRLSVNSTAVNGDHQCPSISWTAPAPSQPRKGRCGPWSGPVARASPRMRRVSAVVNGCCATSLAARARTVLRESRAAGFTTPAPAARRSPGSRGRGRTARSSSRAPYPASSGPAPAHPRGRHRHRALGRTSCTSHPADRCRRS